MTPLIYRSKVVVSHHCPKNRSKRYRLLPSPVDIKTLGIPPVRLSRSAKPPFNNFILTDLLFFHHMSGDTYNLVRSRYGFVAKYSDNIQHREVEKNIARAFSYTAEDLSALPEKANLGLSCGNPVGFANLKEVWLCYLVQRAPTIRF